MAQQMNQRPQPHEIDGIAHFTQATRELAASPLFSEDYGRIGFAGHINAAKEFEIQNVKLPSAMVRDSVILPFRRVWMQNEASFYRKIIRDLKRYASSLLPLTECYEKQLETCLRSHTDPWLSKKATLRPEEIIELWLNSRLAHSGTSAPKGKFDRSDFDAQEKSMGTLVFETLYVEAIIVIGGCFISLGAITEQLLNDIWKPQGIIPSFSLDNLTVDGVYVFGDGTSVTRSSPGLMPQNETPTVRLLRLIERLSYASLKSFLSVFAKPIESLADDLLEAGNLDDFVGRQGLVLIGKPPVSGLLHLQSGAHMLDMPTRLKWMVQRFASGELYIDDNARTVITKQIHDILHEG